MSVEYECVRCGAPTNEPTMCIKCQRGESSFAAPTLLEDAERHATQLEKRVLDLDSRRQSLQREIEIISNIHQWLNVERHKAAALVDRIKAASSNAEASEPGTMTHDNQKPEAANPRRNPGSLR